MKRLFLLLLIISAYAIAACSAPATTAPIVADSAPSGNVNIDNLPLNVDVATVRALQGRDDVILIDVREPEEYAAGHIPGVHLIPMGEVPSRLNEIPTDKTVIVTCRSGNRSGQITDFLRATASPAFTICRVVCWRGKRPDTPSRSNQGRPGKPDIVRAGAAPQSGAWTMFRRSGALLLLQEEADMFSIAQHSTRRQCSKSVCWHPE